MDNLLYLHTTLLITNRQHETNTEIPNHRSSSCTNLAQYQTHDSQVKWASCRGIHSYSRHPQTKAIRNDPRLPCEVTEGYFQAGQSRPTKCPADILDKSTEAFVD